MTQKILRLVCLLGCVTVLQAQPDFITTWETITDNESITIPTIGSGYNYTVVWGDGETTPVNIGNATHTYRSAGTYEVKITGDFPRIYFNNKGDKLKIKSIKHWGEQVWTSMANAFYGCENLVGNADDTPDLSNVTDTSGMFYRATHFNQNINDWNVSNVTNMSLMFSSAYRFNQPLGNWNVLNVTDMSYMFFTAIRFNQDISNWDVSNVTTMRGMFTSALAFNQDIGNWKENVQNVKNMAGMFYGASNFNVDLGLWNVENVTNMDAMFNGALKFNQDLSNWDVSNVQNMTNIFNGVTLSNENYEALLEDWSKRSLQDGIAFNGGDSKYCEESGRQKLIDDFNWTITDGGQDCSLSTPDVLTKTFKVYPIPTSGGITVDVDANIEELTLYNLQGVEVQSKAQEYGKTIDLSGLSSGTYVLKVQTDEGAVIRRIIKE